MRNDGQNTVKELGHLYLNIRKRLNAIRRHENINMNNLLKFQPLEANAGLFAGNVDKPEQMEIERRENAAYLSSPVECVPACCSHFTYSHSRQPKFYFRYGGKFAGRTA